MVVFGQEEAQCLCCGIVGNRSVTRDRDPWSGVSRAHPPHAVRPCRGHCIGQVAEIGARDRFKKTPAKQNFVMRKPRYDVIARVARTGENTLREWTRVRQSSLENIRRLAAQQQDCLSLGAHNVSEFPLENLTP